MQHIGTQPFETARLLCRRFLPEDCEAMFRNWASDPRVQPEYGEPVYSSIPQVRELLTRYLTITENRMFTAGQSSGNPMRK